MVIRVLPTYLVGASSFPSTDSNLIITRYDLSEYLTPFAVANSSKVTGMEP